jgi:hypothetical protein
MDQNWRAIAEQMRIGEMEEGIEAPFTMALGDGRQLTSRRRLN